MDFELELKWLHEMPGAVEWVACEATAEDKAGAQRKMMKVWLALVCTDI